MQVKKGQELDLTIESLAYGGKGIARVDDFVTVSYTHLRAHET